MNRDTCKRLRLDLESEIRPQEPVREGLAPRPRVRVPWLVAVVCLGLLVGGSSRRLPSVDAAPPVTPTLAESIESVLADWNPHLSTSQRERVAAAVLRYGRKYGLDPELVTAVILVESGARPWVRSAKGAVGLMQVMPHMMEPLGLAGNAYTIETNIEAGCWILAHNISRLGEDRGISAYFWGSEIRGVAYLERVRAAREALRARRTS